MSNDVTVAVGDEKVLVEGGAGCSSVVLVAGLVVVVVFVDVVVGSSCVVEV